MCHIREPGDLFLFFDFPETVGELLRKDSKFCCNTGTLSHIHKQFLIWTVEITLAKILQNLTDLVVQFFRSFFECWINILIRLRGQPLPVIQDHVDLRFHL